MSVSSPAQEAAATIVDLIHSRPTSPRVEEVEAIIAKAMRHTAPADASAQLDRLRALIAKVEAADAKARETRADADIDAADQIGDEFNRVSEEVWAAPPCSVEDLQERALIARYWFQPDGQTWDKPEDLDDWAERTVAELIDAVLRMEVR